MRLRVFAIVVVALLILAGGGAVWSQTVQGVITGTVTDPTGAVVPGATVTITNVGTNISQNTTTGSDGSYRFSLVPPGTYTVDVKATNFAEVRAAGVVVEASQIVPYSVKLELAKSSQVIEVTSQAPLVQTASSDLGFQVDSSTIQHAALVDRDVFDVLPFMAPSVQPGLDMTGPSGTTPAATSGGSREAGMSYMLNGSEDNNNFSAGAININPPLESVEDFSLITNSMGAQYGRGMGAVVSANQKSGTNKFHGVLYEQNRNATLNANDFFYNRDFPSGTRPKYIKNQFGGAVGGPIRKDKTFFFFAYDRLKLLQGVTAADEFAPTSAALATLKANAGTSPIGQRILFGSNGYSPVTSDAVCPSHPNNTGAGFNVGCLSFSDPQITTNNAYYGRVDQNFSSSDRLSFVANVNRNNFADQFGGGGNCTAGACSVLSNGSGGLLGIPSITLLNNHNLALVETHTFSSRVANEVNLSHNRFFNPSTEGNPAKQTAPRIIIDNRAEGVLPYNFGPGEGGQVVGFVQDRWALQDNLIWTAGRHALKLGGSANYGILYRNWDLGLPGDYEFGELNGTFSPATDCEKGFTGPCSVGSATNPAVLQPDGTLAGISSRNHSNFANDYPYFEETSIDPRIAAPNKANAYRHYTTHDYSVFGQDDWKFTSRLTLNLGLRWERFGAPAEDHGIMAQFTNIASCDVARDAACIAAARVGPVSRMWKTYNKDFGPRVGFAWDPFGKGKMAVRGGYGIYYDRIFDNIWSNGAWNPPFYALIDFNAFRSDAIFYANPASIGAGYNPNGPNGPIPYPGKRVSVRTMDVNMHDSSGQNFYLGVEREVLPGFLLSAKYQGAMGRHLPMLEFYNRVDGIGYNSTLTPIRPNPLYTGFNYRSNSVSSNYNALIVEAHKRTGRGLQFDTSYTFSKQLDVNSELFAGCSNIGSFTAPYYYISNALPHLNYGRGAEDHRHAYKFNVTYDLPFLKAEKGVVGHILGGWSLGSFFQLYSGHPIDVFDGRSTYAASVLDANGIPLNLGGDYNLDFVENDHPVFVGGNINSVYSGASPADGIFKDNNIIGCGAPWVPASAAAAVAACNASFGVVTPNSLFVTPGYPTSGSLFKRYGTLGRDIFHGPRFVNLDFGLHKNFKLTERADVRFSAEAQNLLNHPNFDGIDSDLSSGTFGQAQFLLGSASRVMSLSLRLSF